MTGQNGNDIKGAPNGDDHGAIFDTRPKWPYWIGTAGRFPSESVAVFIGRRSLFQAARALARGYRNTATFITMIYLIAAPLGNLFNSI